MKLFFFQILVFYTEVTFHLVPDADQVAPAVKVSHFDCSSMTENSLYAINQVRPCHITPEELEVSKPTITLYTKHFRKKLNATKCRIQHQREKWHCGHLDHSSLDHITAGITSDLIILPEHCRTLAKGASINLQGHWIGAEWDTKSPVVKVSGDPTGSNRNHCKTKGWISRDTFIIHIQKTTLKVTMENGKVLSDMGLILPCALEELGCETTSLDPYAYFWDYPDNCVLSILRKKMSTWLSKTGNTTSFVEKTLHPNLCLKSRIIHENIVEHPLLFTQQITTRSIWLDSVKVSIWIPEEILAVRRTEQLKYFSIWDPERKTILVNFTRITLSWKGHSSNKKKNLTVI